MRNIIKNLPYLYNTHIIPCQELRTIEPFVDTSESRTIEPFYSPQRLHMGSMKGFDMVAPMKGFKHQANYFREDFYKEKYANF